MEDEYCEKIWDQSLGLLRKSLKGLDGCQNLLKEGDIVKIDDVEAIQLNHFPYCESSEAALMLHYGLASQLEDEIAEF